MAGAVLGTGVWFAVLFTYIALNISPADRPIRWIVSCTIALLCAELAGIALEKILRRPK